jgi:hypothetical protein
LNPSFKPPTPISDTLKTQIFDQYLANPTVNDVRSLATRYGMSIKRVDAILRLKGLEAHWQKVSTFHPDTSGSLLAVIMMSNID